MNTYRIIPDYESFATAKLYTYLNEKILTQLTSSNFAVKRAYVTGDQCGEQCRLYFIYKNNTSLCEQDNEYNNHFDLEIINNNIAEMLVVFDYRGAPGIYNDCFSTDEEKLERQKEYIDTLDFEKMYNDTYNIFLKYITDVEQTKRNFLTFSKISTDNISKNQIVRFRSNKNEIIIGFEPDGYTIKCPKNVIGYLMGHNGKYIKHLQRKYFANFNKKIKIIPISENFLYTKAEWLIYN